MDRVTFDFEKDLMIIENDAGTQETAIFNLSGKKELIMTAANSFDLMEYPATKKYFESYSAGEIDAEELLNNVLEEITDTLKSKYHEDLS